MNYILYDRKTIMYFIDYINSIFKNINFEKIEIDKNLLLFIRTRNDNKNKFIFFEKIPSNLLKFKNILNNLLLINTEQMTRIEKKNILLSYPNEIKIIDYSFVNYNILKPLKNITYLPYQVNYDEIFNYEKNKQIAMIGSMSIRRKNIFNKIKLFDKIDLISGWNAERDEQLFRYKILVNVHFDLNYNIFEELRCNRCIFNKIIVITEKSLYDENILKDYVIECEYDEICDKVLEVSKNYDYYYNKLFGSNLILDNSKKNIINQDNNLNNFNLNNFNLIEIDNKLKNIHSNFINLLNK